MKFKRVISVVLCIMMLLGNAGIVVNSAAATVVASGECGENATWVLDSDGVLTISGYGEMENYYVSGVNDYNEGNDRYAPWYYYGAVLKKVIIEDGITNIGDFAFIFWESLKDVVLPDSITSIGEFAFCDCGFSNFTIPDTVTDIRVGAFYSSRLTDVTIPGSIKNIELATFFSCSQLECVTIENGVSHIDNFAFAYCDSLQSLEIPDSVTSIGVHAFAGSALQSVEISDSVTSIGALAFGSETLTGYAVDENNNYFSSDNGILYNKDKTTLENYPAGKEDTFFCVPDSVTNIAMSAFYGCVSLEIVTIPESVEVIGYSAFYACDALESISILNPECMFVENIDDEVLAEEGAPVIPETAVIYGYANSTAQAYAEKYGNTFIAIDGEDTSEDINVSDKENSGVQFDFAENTFDESHGKVSVEIKKDVTQSQYLLSDFSKVTAWNITFYNEAGEEIQPGAPVTVKKPIPEDYNSGFLMVLHIDPQTGQGNMVEFTVEDGFVVFEASSFSVYVLVDTSSEIEDEPTIEPDSPSDEPDEPAAPSCDHFCHKSGFMGVVWKIVRFFWKLFNMNPVCECGAAHY